MESSNKGLVVLLCVLLVVILGLVIGVVASLVVTESENSIDEIPEVVVMDKMEGWDGEVSEATRALIFSNDIRDKIEDDSGYDVNNAIRDYVYAFRNSSNSLKFYIAIEYANFVYDTFGDIDSSTEIMLEVENIAKSDEILEGYYNNVLYLLYYKSGNEERAEYYEQLVNKDVSTQEEI